MWIGCPCHPDASDNSLTREPAMRKNSIQLSAEITLGDVLLLVSMIRAGPELNALQSSTSADVGLKSTLLKQVHAILSYTIIAPV